jgi:hypothetical protein
MTLAPEHELVSQITTAEQKQKWKLYRKLQNVPKENMADVKNHF